MRKRIACLILALAALLSLASACGSRKAAARPVETTPSPAPEETVSPEPSPEEAEPGDAEETPAPDETPEPAPAPDPVVKLVPYDGVVEHLFFHPAVAYPELAFDGDAKEKGIDDYMVTVSEYKKILQSLYDNGYILVDINDVWSEVTGENGAPRMVRNTLYIPEGKKPLILSFDDVNYYEYMLKNGFTYKLVLRDGEIWSYGLDPKGNPVYSQDLDVVTILDKFVKEHPDFSLNGAKGCLSITGYEGILGYRTHTDVNDTSEEAARRRAAEIEAVKPIVQKLKETGWTFGCHSWGHIDLSRASLEKVKSDTERWMNEVGSLVGPTKIYFYPFGSRPDGSDVKQPGPVFKYLQSMGFRVFASVGSSSYSKIKTDISAVICDRMHPDGMTLRHQRDRYLRFYDAKEVFDFENRPDYGVSWS